MTVGTSSVPEFCHDCGKTFGLYDRRLILGDRRYHADTCGPMPEQATFGPFRWAVVNADGHEYLIGRGRFGDEFVKVAGECVRRPIKVRDGEQGDKA